MPIRKQPLATDQYVHVMNRGVAKMPTFLGAGDYSRAIETLKYYRFVEPPIKYSDLQKLTPLPRAQILRNLEGEDQLVEIIAFTTMPNHFHLLLRQLVDDGVSTFLRRWTNSYTRYFNTRHERIGPLFQGVFKSVAIHSDDQLLHVSRYIHINLVVAELVELQELASSPRTSYGAYVGRPQNWLNPELILGIAGGEERYRKFVADHVDYAQALESIKHLTLE